jgi:hypothetical protein
MIKKPIVKTEDVLKGDETETVSATFAKKALARIRTYHQTGLKEGSWDLDEPHFLAWMVAVAVVGLRQGKKQENEKDRKITELEEELNRLKKAQK